MSATCLASPAVDLDYLHDHRTDPHVRSVLEDWQREQGWKPTRLGVVIWLANAYAYANANAYADANANANANAYAYANADAKKLAVKRLADGMVECLARVFIAEAA